MHLDQIEGKEEEGAAERGVEQQGEEVGPGKRAGAEQVKRHHRRGRAFFDHDKPGQEEHAASEGAQDDGIPEAQSGPLQEPEDQRAQPERDEGGAGKVEPMGVLISAFRDPAQCDE